MSVEIPCSVLKKVGLQLRRPRLEPGLRELAANALGLELSFLRARTRLNA
jgi:hypothetical protein